METLLLPVVTPCPVAELSDESGESPAPVASSDTAPLTAGEIIPLPEEKHKQAFGMKLAGRTQAQIAQHYGVTESTIYRWQQAYLAEYRASVESSQQIDIISEKLAELADLATVCRKSAETEKSGRAKSSFLGVAHKAISEQIKLMLESGILDRSPERIYKIVAHHKPDQSDTPQAKANRPREQVIADLIEKLSSASQL